MKKIILTAVVVGSLLASCKKEEIVQPIYKSNVVAHDTIWGDTTSIPNTGVYTFSIMAKIDYISPQPWINSVSSQFPCVCHSGDTLKIKNYVISTYSTDYFNLYLNNVRIYHHNFPGVGIYDTVNWQYIVP